MTVDNIRTFTYEDLGDITDGFSVENFITKFQFGSVFHGNLQRLKKGAQDRRVTVKIWDGFFPYYLIRTEGHYRRLQEEITLSKHVPYASHPNLVKLLGCYQDGKPYFGIVYDLAAHDTLHNLLLQDDFGWLQRVKIAIQLAYLLQFLHTHADADVYSAPCLIRNLNASHIIVDMDGNAILFDFGMISGGIFTDMRLIREPWLRLGCIGYTDPEFIYGGVFGWCEKTEVFAYGIILLCLITKKGVHLDEIVGRNDDAVFMQEWARDKYQPNHDLVNYILKRERDYDSRDGLKITELAIQCTEFERVDRPTMKEVVEALLDLHITKCNGLMLSIDPRVTHDTNFRQAIRIRNQRFLSIKKINKKDKVQVDHSTVHSTDTL